MSKIVCVVPTIRPEQMEKFRSAWDLLFKKHDVKLVTVWDGDNPEIECGGKRACGFDWGFDLEHVDLFCRRTDACRNLGFAVAAKHLNPDLVLTLDDDVAPIVNDPIQEHLNVLAKRVPISWMNTAHDTDLYLRGIPYSVRDEAPVMLSHGVWCGVPDFDGETQLKLEESGGTKDNRVVGYKGVPYTLPYHVGPVPKGVLFSLCGMNVMVRREALPYFYFAPMGMDVPVGAEVWGNKPGSGVPLNRFADIWMGIFLKREFDRLGWACYTGASTVLHTRASDARKNFEQEKLGREWNEYFHRDGEPYQLTDSLRQRAEYMRSYADKRRRYAELINSLLK